MRVASDVRGDCADDGDCGSLLLREVRGDACREPTLRLLADAGFPGAPARAWSPGRRVYVLCDLADGPDDRPVAVAVVGCHPDVATMEICAVAVAPEHRGRGLGRRLLTEVGDVLLRGGTRRVVAPATVVAPEETAVFRDAGFCRCGDQWYAREL